MLKKFKRYLQEELRYSEGSVDNLHSTVVEFVTWCDSQGLNPARARYTDLIAYMKHMEKNNKSINGINRNFGALRHYYNHLVESGKVKNNPAVNIYKAGRRRRTVHSTFTREELDQIYYSLPETKDREILFKCLTGLIVYQAATPSELGRMLPEHIDLAKGTVYFTASLRSNPRELKLEPQQIMLLAKYLNETRPDLIRARKKYSKMLFFTIGGGDTTCNLWYSLNAEIKKYQPRLNNLKQLRANVIVHWLRTENPIRVKYMAGHRYVSSTEYYQLEDIETLKEELETFFPKL